jgi:DNA-binding PadR family transcriptional regulator
MEAIAETPKHGLQLQAELGLPLSVIYGKLIGLRQRGLVSFHRLGRLKVYSLTQKGRRLFDQKITRNGE